MATTPPRPEPDPPSAAAWDGPALVAAFEAGTVHLARYAHEIDALNVFPVPDGDTGSNMLATARAALQEARALGPAGHSVGRVAEAVSFGALMGARGNSGVILSQILRGVADAVRGEPTLDGPALARALLRGSQAADAAVATPVEGTILTVAREAAKGAATVAELGGSLAAVLLAAIESARVAVARTPELLPILREAGVVDAGGQGLVRILEGIAAPGRGGTTADPGPWSAATQGAAEPGEWRHTAGTAAPDGGFGYETVYLLSARETPLDPAAIRVELEALGESVLVAGDDRAVKVHVHNARPDAVIAYGLARGSLTRITVENLDQQASERRAPSVPASHAVTPLAVVAVAAGDGMVRAFRELGATRVVRGGQTANPSSGELLEAVRETGAEHVVVLPNNRNVRLAAEQAAGLAAGKDVVVIPTRNAAEGLAALLALDPKGSIEDNTRRMSEAVSGIQTLVVTRAMRDARLAGRQVRRGEAIAMDPDEGLIASDIDTVGAAIAGVRAFEPGFELLTVYRGADAEPTEATTLSEAIRETFPGVEVEVVDGGQPHASFLIAAE